MRNQKSMAAELLQSVLIAIVGVLFSQQAPGAPLWGTSTSKLESLLVLHWLLLNKNTILSHSLIISISLTNKT